MIYFAHFVIYCLLLKIEVVSTTKFELKIFGKIYKVKFTVLKYSHAGLYFFMNFKSVFVELLVFY